MFRSDLRAVICPLGVYKYNKGIFYFRALRSGFVCLEAYEIGFFLALNG